MSWSVPIPGQRTPIPAAIEGLQLEVLALGPERDGPGRIGITRNTLPNWAANTNALVRYDENFKVRCPVVLLRPLMGTLVPTQQPVVYDMRFVRWQPDGLVTAGVQFEWGHAPEQFYEYLWNPETGACLGSRRLSHTKKPEKNWLPLPWGGYLCDHDPVRCIGEDGRYDVVRVVPTPFQFEVARGSAAPIPYKDGFLYVIHEVLNHKESPHGSRRYRCRFIWIQDRNWTGMRVSPPFQLLDGIVELCFSIHDTPAGVVMACNSMGTTGFLITVDHACIDTLLSPF